MTAKYKFWAFDPTHKTICRCYQLHKKKTVAMFYLLRVWYSFWQTEIEIELRRKKTSFYQAAVYKYAFSQENPNTVTRLIFAPSQFRKYLNVSQVIHFLRLYCVHTNSFSKFLAWDTHHCWGTVKIFTFNLILSKAFL